MAGGCRTDQGKQCTNWAVYPSALRCRGIYMSFGQLVPWGRTQTHHRCIGNVAITNLG